MQANSENSHEALPPAAARLLDALPPEEAEPIRQALNRGGGGGGGARGAQGAQGGRGGHGDDRAAVLRARHALGSALIEAGDPALALDLLEPLPDAFATLPEPDPEMRGAALASLGRAYLRMGRPMTATNFFGQALELARAESDVERQGDLFGLLADAAKARGDAVAEAAARDRAADLDRTTSSQQEKAKRPQHP